MLIEILTLSALIVVSVVAVAWTAYRFGVDDGEQAGVKSQSKLMQAWCDYSYDIGFSMGRASAGQKRDGKGRFVK